MLAEAQSALAHTCIVAFRVQSARLDFSFEGFGALVNVLQTKCERDWAPASLAAGGGAGGFAVAWDEQEAKRLVRALRQRLREFLLTMQTEIITEENSKPGVATASGAAAGNAGAGGGGGGVVAPGANVNARQAGRLAPRRVVPVAARAKAGAAPPAASADASGSQMVPVATGGFNLALGRADGFVFTNDDNLTVRGPFGPKVWVYVGWCLLRR